MANSFGKSIHLSSPPDSLSMSSSPLTTGLFTPDLDRQEKAEPSDILDFDLEKALSLSLKITPGNGVDLSELAFLGLSFQHHTHDVNNNDPNSKRKSHEKKIWRETSKPYVRSDDIPTDFLRIIKPAQPVLLYRKRLFPADVSRSQNRLLVTETHNLRLFLTCDERRKIYSGENNSCIEVIGVDYMGRKFDLRLSKWGGRGDATTNNTKMNKHNKKMSIVFNRRWSDMLEANEVERDDIVELWGFRKDESFCVVVNFIYQ